MKKRLIYALIIFSAAMLIWITESRAEEGDFSFTPEFGLSHLFSSDMKEGMYAGAHFGYDTSDNLAIELIMLYGDNNSNGPAGDLRYVIGGGGLSYKILWGRFKPSAFAGGQVAAFDYAATDANVRGGLYVGTAFEFYLNKVVLIGLSFKYLPVVNAPDALLFGFRFGFEL